MSRSTTPLRTLPRSPAQPHLQQHQNRIDVSTTPTVYSFNNTSSASALPPQHHNVTFTPRAGGGASSGSTVSPYRRISTPVSAAAMSNTPSASAALSAANYHAHHNMTHHLTSSNHQPTTMSSSSLPRRGSSPSNLVSPYVAPPSMPLAPAAAAPAGNPVAASPPNSSSSSSSFSHNNNNNNYDRVLVESMNNAKRAEAAAAERDRAEATLKEISREQGEKLRTAQGKVRALQLERDNLHRTSLEQSDTIAKLRDQIAQSGKTRSAADRLRTENVQLKERLRETEARLKEADAIRGELHRRLGDQERSAHSRTANMSDLKGQLHSKDELVSSLSETVRARDATVGKLSGDLQVVSEELSREQAQHKRSVSQLEQTLVECKERELLLRRQVSDARAEAEAIAQDRDQWRGAAESANIHCATISQRALDGIVELEMHSRGLLELSFSHVALQDNSNMFAMTAAAASQEHHSCMGKIARLLDDTDSLMKELRDAQEMAKHGAKEREILGTEVKNISENATDTMRNLEHLTSTASWRRAVIETLVPEEIAQSIAQIRSAVAETVHRTNLVSKRALRGPN